MTDTEFEDLLAQQQRDRQQLLAYAARIDLQAARISELEQRLGAASLEHDAKLAEAQALNATVAEQLAGLRAEHETFRVALLTQQAADRQRYEEERDALLAQHAANCQRYDEELHALRAWQDAMLRSRTYRLLTLYRALYDAPIIGTPLRATRRLVSKMRRQMAG